MDWCVVSNLGHNTTELINLTEQQENIGIGKFAKQERELAVGLENNLDLDSTILLPQQSASPKPQSPSFSFSLSSFPSSFTTLLLSIVDSPAYSNLTTAYLNNVFNPTTPDDPKVKYFSVASRLSGVSIWHPLWLPKAVLDETEQKQRLKLKHIWEGHQANGRVYTDGDDDEGVPLWAQEREWGNDGLVSVQSAKWGEFLGTMEGCDRKRRFIISSQQILKLHFFSDWEMRGARGFDIDLPSLNNIGFGLSSSTGAWSILDWCRFVTAWKREERIERDAKLQKSRSVQRSSSSAQSNFYNDDVVKASTDRLSTVFDWLLDQFPASAKLISMSSSSTGAANAPVKAPKRVTEAANEALNELRQKVQIRTQEQKVATAMKTNTKTNELQRKEDLERFYVALSRKIYDEGL